MNHRLGRWPASLGVLVCAVVAYTLFVSGGESPAVGAASSNAGRAQGRETRELPNAGLVARLPFVGTLTWRCDEERRFYTQLRLPNPGATVYVSLDADGKRIWRMRQVNPAPPPKGSVVGPFASLRRQTWVIRYNHAPATLTVIARLRFAAPTSRSQCVVSPARIEIHRTPH